MNRINTGIQGIEKACKVLEEGGVIVYPTDTLYGIGALLKQPEAVSRVYDMKKMKPGPLSIVLSDRSRVKEYAEASKISKNFLEIYPAGPYTLLLRIKSHVKKQLPEHIVEDGRIGIRIPMQDFPRKLAGCTGAFTSTSANIHEESSPADFKDVKMKGADLYVDGGRCYYGEPSTILKDEGDKLTVVREGAMKKSLIEHYLE